MFGGQRGITDVVAYQVNQEKKLAEKSPQL